MGIYLDEVIVSTSLGGSAPTQTFGASDEFEGDTDYVVTVPLGDPQVFRFDFNGTTGDFFPGSDPTVYPDVLVQTSNTFQSNSDGSFFYQVIGATTDIVLMTVAFDSGVVAVGDRLEITVSVDPADTTPLAKGTDGDVDKIIFEVGPPGTALSITCFAPGTGIATPDGERAVERLRPGDPILTADGRTMPVKWIGRQTRNKLFTPEDRLRPVRVQAGALGPGIPHTDLILTADHALIVDGLAINAGALVNGTTITLEPIAALDYSVTYYHIETEDHDVILANGAPAETYIDYVSRRTFDNYAASCDEARIVKEMEMPRISAARLVPPEIKARLSGRTAA